MNKGDDKEFEVVFAETAKEDLENILFHIAEDQLENAIKFVDELISTVVNTLSVFPHCGIFFGTKQGLDVHTHVVHKFYTVYYAVNAELRRVEVFTVFNTNKDNKEFWGELESRGIYKFTRA